MPCCGGEQQAVSLLYLEPLPITLLLDDRQPVQGSQFLREVKYFDASSSKARVLRSAVQPSIKNHLDLPLLDDKQPVQGSSFPREVKYSSVVPQDFN